MNNETMTVLQKETIKRHKKMIEWAKKQNPNDYPDPFLMAEGTGHTWESDSPYCIYFDYDCEECPLIGRMSGYCCSGLWETMSVSSTWWEWIFWAKLIIEYVEKHGIIE